MHSLRGWNWVVVGSVATCVSGLLLPSPAITPAPQAVEIELRSLMGRQAPDAVSMMEILLTALPVSLRLIAATNIPAVSSIIWQDFLDDKKPDWFRDLPGDVQTYLIRQFGPSTAWPTASPSASSKSSASSSSGSTTSSTVSKSSTGSSAPTSSLTTAKVASDNDDNSGLTRRQKLGIGIGVGVPLGLLVIAALLFCCCFLSRRRRRRRIEGSEPPSSPGFIPRFSFQDKHANSEHRTPLHSRKNHSSHSVMTWDDDGYNAAEWGAMPKHDPRSAAPMAMHDANPIMAPALFHTHTSNRARGTRTSYTSLRSVAEVTEPDDNITEPALSEGKVTPPPPKHTLRRLSQPLHMEVPIVLSTSSVRRKPIPSSPTSSNHAADMASRSLRRPDLITSHERGSSSSGRLLSNGSSLSGFGIHTDPSTPISPMSDSAPKNPFIGENEYVEDYGPEYSHNGYNGYTDLEDSLYGGHRSLDRYPDSSHTRRSSKTEWPLRNVIGSTQKRTKSPLWDRVYER